MKNSLLSKPAVISSVLVIFIAIVIFALPEKKDKEQLSAEQLLIEMNNHSRLMTADEVTAKIISKSPEIQLIDLRSEAEYQEFRLPGAINIPFEKLLDKDSAGNYIWDGYLNQTSKTNVFYSNGSIYANMAWIICRRLNFSNNYIMEGGLNEWYENLMLSEAPKENATPDEINTYKFRQAARMFFSGDAGSAPSSSGAPAVPIQKSNAAPSGGGC